MIVLDTSVLSEPFKSKPSAWVLNGWTARWPKHSS